MHFFIHLFAFSASTLVVRHFTDGKDRQRLVGIFALAYLVRAAYILFLHQFSRAGFFFLDDIGYNDQAQLIAFGRNIGPLSEALGTMHTGYPALIGFLYSLADHSVLSGKMLNALFGALLVPVCFAICRQLWPGDKQLAFRSAWVVALFPSAIAWAGFLLKDVALELLFASIVLLTLLAIQKRVWAIVALVAALYLASFFRFYAVVIWVAGAFCSGIGYLIRRYVPKFRFLAFCGIPIGLAVLFGTAFFWLANDSESLQPLLTFYYAGATAGDVTVLNPSLVAIGRAIFIYFLGPFPWVFGGFDPVNYVFFPGMYVTYAMFPIAAFGYWKQIRDLDPIKILTFSPLMLLAVIEIYFFQGAPRQRLMCEFLFCLCFSAAWPMREEFSRLTKLSYAAFGLVAFGHILANLN